MAGAEDILAICIDIGTDTTAVAVYWRRPGVTEPLVTNVCRWPGEQNVSFEHTPSAVVYSNDNEVAACGAEAYTHEMRENIEECNYKLVKHFKLHLYPHNVLKGQHHHLESLPSGITIERVYIDFLTYLISQIRRHVKSCVGVDPWPIMQNQAKILLTHPNVWGRFQQEYLKNFIAMAEIMPMEETSNRLFFAEEGEAAASWCIPASSIMQPFAVSIWAKLIGSYQSAVKF
ncbi:hypothetical protein DL93DRAFT_1964049 [Clavulina sp. PMI_390]|nr:hypothetical protein DL93DRAFT_1964049 [Clavulina sp. PMI_390]